MKVNARTYQSFLKFILEKNLFKEKQVSIKKKLSNLVDLTDWYHLDQEDLSWASFSYNGKQVNLPFLDNQERFITKVDLDNNQFIFNEFSTLVFTASAFQSNLDNVLVDTETRRVEKFGELVKVNPKENALTFSEEVCSWGRGQRVWANLKRLNKDTLESKLFDWFKLASNVNNSSPSEIKNVIKVGDDIPGLGVSFASKHLRMINPNVFPVLDDVLARGLGFALNENGYVLFIKNINSFRKQYEIPESVRVADIEMVLFLLVRQLVRSN